MVLRLLTLERERDSQFVIAQSTTKCVYALEGASRPGVRATEGDPGAIRGSVPCPGTLRHVDSNRCELPTMRSLDTGPTGPTGSTGSTDPTEPQPVRVKGLLPLEEVEMASKEPNIDDEDALEVLGEQLYDMIYPKHAEMAGKLTGMLLELPGAVLTQILQDEAMLTEALEKALRALKMPPSYSKMTSQDEDEASTLSDSLGEQLFELVDVYNTGHTQKITGMLLEQHREAVLNLLSEPSLLEEQVNMALKTLRGQNGEEPDVSDSSDADDPDRLGERLFALVEEIDAAHSKDITGMLLEMDSGTLRQMLSNRTMLEVAVQKAQAALESIWTQEDKETLNKVDLKGQDFS